MVRKFGLLEYDTENIGDEIQSIAARRFLPRVDYYFNRDNVDATKTRPDEKIKLIMNGWYTHHPENWPPKNPNLEPLLIAMHVEQEALDGRSAKAFLTDESKRFLEKFGPVGARNISTLELLEKNGVRANFSGCITLTLCADKQVRKRDFILLVDVSDRVYQKVSKETKRPIYRLNTNRKKNLDRETRFLLAELWLLLYQSAHMVVTTRLHAMLPCLALETPVIGISGRDPKRYEGLIDLVNRMSEKEFLESKINFEHPPKNPEDYKKMRKNLEEKCRDYTGFDAKKSYLDEKTPDELVNNPKLRQFFLDAVFDTWLAEEYSKAKINLEQTLENNRNVEYGIRDSLKLLMKATKKRLKLKF